MESCCHGDWDYFVWTRSTIRRGIQGDELATATAEYYLHCNTSMKFYVSWENGLIRVGKDNIQMPAFMEYQEENVFPIYGVSLSTGNGNTGNWRFEENYGEKGRP